MNENNNIQNKQANTSKEKENPKKLKQKQISIRNIDSFIYVCMCGTELFIEYFSAYARHYSFVFHSKLCALTIAN